ncbi:restriction endonuclease subunit S [Serratia liquefaciens]|uniref:restriction endonuclease subunit S n=1 Tax=Serratia liquefaciens TaxID=614 RepID=UPI000D5193BA|nr:restriction endonuclease subunit S [Serratia liquefaciens]PVD39941.1 restriction endonuclease subunit S [Serratia liquefaciens]QHT52846.1 restriction endonuclease subunit S [Serratia liquefaciens]
MSFELYEYKIEDLGKVITGKTPPSKISDAFSAQGIPFVTPKDMDGRRLIDKTERYLSSQGVEAVRNCLLPQNSIAVSCIGSDMGKAVLLPGESITNQQINAIVVDSERFDYKYVYYYLSTLQDDFKAIAGGSATPILNKGHFSQFKVSLPVKLVQNKIALILDSLDTKIEVNTEISHTLEQMAQALFKSWFVDFEPVKAKMAVLEAGGSQAEATLAAMTAISGKDADALTVFEREHPEQYAELKTTSELFPSAMQDSELGGIPEGWCVESYRTFCDFVQSGGTPKRSEQTYWDDGDIRWLSSGEVRDKIVFDTKEKITEVGLKNSTAKLWPKYSTIMAMYGATAGEICLLANEMSANQACCALYSKKYSFFIYFSLCNGASFIASKASGSAQQNLNKSIIENAVFCKPTESLIEIYNKTINDLMLMWISNVKYNNNLTQLRDTLLPKLISGEITLPEAEQAVSEAENV